MRGQHLRRTLGSDHRANSDSHVDLDVSANHGDVGSAWAIACVVFVLLGLLSVV
jgi:hypothetical protein